MKILETVVLSQKPQYFQELISLLPLEKENVLGIDVYRFEIEVDLVILMYDVNGTGKMPSEIIDHLPPHLSAFLLIAEDGFSEALLPGLSFVNELAKDLPEIPMVIALRSETDNLTTQKLLAWEEGLYLSEKGRIFFWTPQSDQTKARVLNWIWKELQVIP